MAIHDIWYRYDLIWHILCFMDRCSSCCINGEVVIFTWLSQASFPIKVRSTPFWSLLTLVQFDMYGIPKKASTWFTELLPKKRSVPLKTASDGARKSEKVVWIAGGMVGRAFWVQQCWPQKRNRCPKKKKKKSYKDTDFAHTSKNQYGTSNIESLVEMIFPFASGCFSQIPAVNFQWISFRESFHRLWKPKNDKVETRNTMLQNQSQPFVCVKRNMVHQKMEAWWKWGIYFVWTSFFVQIPIFVFSTLTCSALNLDPKMGSVFEKGVSWSPSLLSSMSLWAYQRAGWFSWQEGWKLPQWQLCSGHWWRFPKPSGRAGRPGCERGWPHHGKTMAHSPSKYIVPSLPCWRKF